MLFYLGKTRITICTKEKELGCEEFIIPVPREDHPVHLQFVTE